MPNRLALPMFAAVLAILAAGCTESESPRDKLVITGPKLPSVFKVGDTTDLWTADKTVILSNGRESTQKAYQSFHLESSDTTVAAIARERMVVGRKAGTAQINARDDKQELVSESSVTVTVVSL